MGWKANWGGGLYTYKDMSQKQLRELAPAKDAARLFQAMLKQSLWPFVGRILEVFAPPKSVGMHFEFAKGTRDKFVRLVNPTALPKKMSMAMRKPKSPLIPDDPGPNVVNRSFRKLAASNGLGVSFRQEGLKNSLHVAYNYKKSECDVHVDRNGFVVKHPDGSVQWDLNAVLRHLTVDLIPDKAPWLTGAVTHRDKKGRADFKATVAPWLVVDLPSEKNGGKTDVKVGVQIQGRFRGL